jgi:small neutral amino acid transporter SnatA (MarC family)
MIGKFFGFFADIFKQVLIKIITYGIIIVFIILCVKYFLGVDILKIFGIS